ncbi:hypothetical protein FF011L_51300 [Roseimaritima multifibrata]|uniref:DUF1598 domain-containing protein n=1 Tax=Roseimaritima multifibrata TaxID=1930274 RepID=A0A517MN66_9BACT|nr:DUF1598 domain-containing protein [Roseimaritima multifibrata]QDS96322.1 hypothetical protein FF011L_51300 [Roseimaritima multifibrata]
MRRRPTFALFAKSALCCLVALAVTCFSTTAEAQDDNNNNDNNNDTNVFVQPVAGVEVDATGVLRVKHFDPRLAIARAQAAVQALPADLKKPSELRKISLNRLEAAIEKAEGADDVMQAMAGLTRIENVFFYPETNDVVIAGPAEPFASDASGRVRGTITGRPVILLEDMVTALRAYAPGDRPTNVISVSIDPTEEGLKRLQQVLRTVRSGLRPGDAARLAMTLKNNLGLQNVTIQGIPANTHFAQVLVEADYRMKLIGIGLEQLPIRMASYVERASPTQIASNAMERWYFVPNYDGVKVSPDGHAMQLSQHGVKLVGANERVAADGQRVAAGRGNRASEAFCKDFTEKYDQIAAVAPVYAQMRNLIDASIAAAYIQQQDFHTQAGWQMELFGDEARFAVESHHSPVQVETAVNAVWKGNTLMTPLGGGVNVQPRSALRSDRKTVDSSGETEASRQAQAPHQLQDGQWWWD